MQCIFFGYSAAEELKNVVTKYVTKYECRLDNERLGELLNKVKDGQKLNILQQTKSEVAGMTALHKAAQRGHADVLKAILSSLRCLDKLELHKTRDYMKRTPLHEAVFSDQTESVKAILDSLRADEQLQLLKEQEWYGKTPVEMASGEMLDVLAEYENSANEG